MVHYSCRLYLEILFKTKQTSRSTQAKYFRTISAINTQDFHGIQLILTIEFKKIAMNFPRQSHFVGICELLTEELAYPPHILYVSYSDYLTVTLPLLYANFLRVPTSCFEGLLVGWLSNRIELL